MNSVSGPVGPKPGSTSNGSTAPQAHDPVDKTISEMADDVRGYLNELSGADVTTLVVLFNEGDTSLQGQNVTAAYEALSEDDRVVFEETLQQLSDTKGSGVTVESRIHGDFEDDVWDSDEDEGDLDPELGFDDAQEAHDQSIRYGRSYELIGDDPKLMRKMKSEGRKNRRHPKNLISIFSKTVGFDQQLDTIDTFCESIVKNSFMGNTPADYRSTMKNLNKIEDAIFKNSYTNKGEAIMRYHLYLKCREMAARSDLPISVRDAFAEFGKWVVSSMDGNADGSVGPGGADEMSTVAPKEAEIVDIDSLDQALDVYLALPDDASQKDIEQCIFDCLMMVPVDCETDAEIDSNVQVMMNTVLPKHHQTIWSVADSDGFRDMQDQYHSIYTALSRYE